DFTRAHGLADVFAHHGDLVRDDRGDSDCGRRKGRAGFLGVAILAGGKNGRDKQEKQHFLDVLERHLDDSGFLKIPRWRGFHPYGDALYIHTRMFVNSGVNSASGSAECGRLLVNALPALDSRRNGGRIYGTSPDSLLSVVLRSVVGFKPESEAVVARKTKEEAEITRERLLDAAAQVFCHRGVTSASLDDIAKTAGVTRGALYWHFRNKTDLMEALWERTK